MGIYPARYLWHKRIVEGTRLSYLIWHPEEEEVKWKFLNLFFRNLIWGCFIFSTIFHGFNNSNLKWARVRIKSMMFIQQTFEHLLYVWGGAEVIAQLRKTLPLVTCVDSINLFASGLSGKLTSRGVCVCISTAFEGNLLDSYFVDLIIQKPLRIHHHSIPVFIPLEELSAKFLQTDIQHFLFCLCEYLNAYAGRKYQADQLQVSVWDLT